MQRRFYDRINLDSQVAEVTITGDDITIYAEPWPMPGRSTRSHYRAHIKIDSAMTWAENIGDSHRPWEIKARESDLWEVAVGYDGNYVPEPQQPNIKRIVEFLRDSGEAKAAGRIEEAYRMH